MKKVLSLIALSIALLTSPLCQAQAPAGAPAGSTGLCNDGSYFKGSVKIGACTGHKGLKTWWGAAKTTTAKTSPAKSTPASKTKPAAAPAPAAAPKPAPSAPVTKTATATTPAPGGGPGMVWLNTSSNVYHCPGSTYYGKTKAGAYMTEDQAKAKGAHANGGKPCSK
ncbi:MAG: signal peptide protein [Terracidiphilus sp.]